MELLLLKEISEPPRHSRALELWKPRKEAQCNVRLPKLTFCFVLHLCGSLIQQYSGSVTVYITHRSPP